MASRKTDASGLKVTDIDFSVIRTAIQAGGKVIEQIINGVHFGSPEIRLLLMDECDIILECRVCRALFRSLPNFVAHKRVYCCQAFAEKNHSNFVYNMAASSQEETVIVQPSTPTDDSQNQKALHKNKKGNKADSKDVENLEQKGQIPNADTLGQIQAGILGKSPAFALYTAAAEKMEQEKAIEKPMDIHLIPIPSNPNAVYISSSENRNSENKMNDGKIPTKTLKTADLTNSKQSPKKSNAPSVSSRVKSKLSILEKNKELCQDSKIVKRSAVRKCSNRNVSRVVKELRQNKEEICARTRNRNMQSQRRHFTVASQRNSTPPSSKQAVLSRAKTNTDSQARTQCLDNDKQGQDHLHNNSTSSSPKEENIPPIHAALGHQSIPGTQAVVKRCLTGRPGALRTSPHVLDARLGDSLNGYSGCSGGDEMKAGLMSGLRRRDGRAVYGSAMDMENICCRVCQKTFSQRRSLIYHCQTRHSDQRTIYPCPYCPRIFYHFWGLTRHLNTNHKKSPSDIDRMRKSLRAKAYRQTVIEQETTGRIRPPKPLLLMANDEEAQVELEKLTKPSEECDIEQSLPILTDSIDPAFKQSQERRGTKKSQNKTHLSVASCVPKERQSTSDISLMNSVIDNKITLMSKSLETLSQDISDSLPSSAHEEKKILEKKKVNSSVVSTPLVLRSFKKVPDNIYKKVYRTTSTPPAVPDEHEESDKIFISPQKKQLQGNVNKCEQNLKYITDEICAKNVVPKERGYCPIPAINMHGLQLQQMADHLPRRSRRRALKDTSLHPERTHSCEVMTCSQVAKDHVSEDETGPMTRDICTPSTLNAERSPALNGIHGINSKMYSEPDAIGLDTKEKLVTVTSTSYLSSFQELPSDTGRDLLTSSNDLLQCKELNSNIGRDLRKTDYGGETVDSSDDTDKMRLNPSPKTPTITPSLANIPVKHSSSSVTDDPTPLHICPHCQRAFGRKISLDSHIKICRKAKAANLLGSKSKTFSAETLSQKPLTDCHQSQAGKPLTDHSQTGKHSTDQHISQADKTLFDQSQFPNKNQELEQIVLNVDPSLMTNEKPEESKQHTLTSEISRKQVSSLEPGENNVLDSNSEITVMRMHTRTRIGSSAADQSISLSDKKFFQKGGRREKIAQLQQAHMTDSFRTNSGFENTVERTKAFLDFDSNVDMHRDEPIRQSRRSSSRASSSRESSLESISRNHSTDFLLPRRSQSSGIDIGLKMSSYESSVDSPFKNIDLDPRLDRASRSSVACTSSKASSSRDSSLERKSRDFSPESLNPDTFTGNGKTCLQDTMKKIKKTTIASVKSQVKDKIITVIQTEKSSKELHRSSLKPEYLPGPNILKAHEQQAVININSIAKAAERSIIPQQLLTPTDVSERPRRKRRAPSRIADSVIEVKGNKRSYTDSTVQGLKAQVISQHPVWRDGSDFQYESDDMSSSQGSGGEQTVRMVEEIWVDKKPGRPSERIRSNRIYVVEPAHAGRLTCQDTRKVCQIVDETGLCCRQCQQHFTSVSNLRRHAIRHLGWRRFKCRLCRFCSYNRSECNTHILRAHPEKLRSGNMKSETFITDLNRQGAYVRSTKKQRTINNRRNEYMHEENIYVRPKSSRKIAAPRGKGEQKQDVPAFPSPIAGESDISDVTKKSTSSCRKTSPGFLEEPKQVNITSSHFNISTRNSPRKFDIRPYHKTDSLGTLYTRKGFYPKPTILTSLGQKLSDSERPEKELSNIKMADRMRIESGLQGTGNGGFAIGGENEYRTHDQAKKVPNLTSDTKATTGKNEKRNLLTKNNSSSQQSTDSEEKHFVDTPLIEAGYFSPPVNIEVTTGVSEVVKIQVSPQHSQADTSKVGEKLQLTSENQQDSEELIHIAIT